MNPHAVARRLGESMTRRRAASIANALRAVRLQRSSLKHTEHRSLPLPHGPWVMGQSWSDLLFAHWPVPEEQMRAAVPAPLELDLFGGTAWLGVTPFEIVGLHARWAPPVPGLSRFPELNVRTYVTYGGRPGIWFFSLDAGSRAAVTAARLAYRLPYRSARMAIERHGGTIHFDSEAETAPARLSVSYEPTGPAVRPAPGTLEHFLTERYRLYTVDRAMSVLSADIHHRPWPLQPARAELSTNTMTAPTAVELPAQEPLLHYAARQDVLVWPLANHR